MSDEDATEDGEDPTEDDEATVADEDAGDAGASDEDAGDEGNDDAETGDEDAGDGDAGDEADEEAVGDEADEEAVGDEADDEEVGEEDGGDGDGGEADSGDDTTEEDEAAGEYEVRFATHVRDWLASQGKHAMRTIQRKAEPLAEDPYPGENAVNEEALPFGAENWYWQRIGRAWAIFYLVDEEAGEVRVADVQRANDARSRYDI